LPKTFVSPELKVFCSDEIKFLTIDNISKKVFEKYNSNDVITLDGLRVKNNHGWYLIRASNTEEALVIRFEGKSKKDKKELSFEVKNLLKNEGLTLDNF
jgi:phosphomannomutase/phosphoglucomutase